MEAQASEYAKIYYDLDETEPYPIILVIGTAGSGKSAVIDVIYDLSPEGNLPIIKYAPKEMKNSFVGNVISIQNELFHCIEVSDFEKAYLTLSVDHMKHFIDAWHNVCKLICKVGIRACLVCMDIKDDIYNDWHPKLACMSFENIEPSIVTLVLTHGDRYQIFGERRTRISEVKAAIEEHKEMSVMSFQMIQVPYDDPSTIVTSNEIRGTIIENTNHGIAFSNNSIDNQEPIYHGYLPGQFYSAALNYIKQFKNIETPEDVSNINNYDREYIRRHLSVCLMTRNFANQERLDSGDGIIRIQIVPRVHENDDHFIARFTKLFKGLRS
jgi:hypothetical protein